MNAVVVGAGIGGLRVAELLRERGVPCLLLEAKDAVGGRVRTAYEEDSHRVRYESGPWRVPETHVRAIAAFRKHGVRLVPTATAAHVAPRMEHVKGLSTWGSNALKRGVAAANALDVATGYVGETHSAAGSAPYVTRDGTYYVAPQGFSELVRRMAGDEVLLSRRVVDVERSGTGYVVRALRRDGNRFVSEEHPCDVVFVCVPPRAASLWPSLTRYAKCVLSRVHAAPLCHVYAACDGASKKMHRASDDDILGQTIASQYDNEWIQASYTSGALARFWSDLRFRSWEQFKDVLRRRLEMLRISLRGEPALHFWPEAYHAWHATPNFTLAHAVWQCVEPNARHLPGVYLAGEAFSSHQAWMEGALETAELAVARFDGRAKGFPTRPPRGMEVCVEGRVVDPTSFVHVHPGGSAALEAHAGENVDAFLEHIGHSDDAWRLAGATQVAWLP